MTILVPMVMKKLRHFLYRYNYTNGPNLNLTKPVDVSLELSSACDMACEYCYHSASNEIPFVKGIMDKNLAFKIILECADLGVNSIKFNYRGEGTINPAYREITDLAKKFARGSTFIDRLANSNFKFHPRRRDDIFLGLSNLTKVKVSYDSFIPSVFETQRKGGNHALTTENINLFYNHPERIKSETEIVIQAVRTKLNKDEDIYSEVKKRWPSAGVSIRDMVAGRGDADLSSLENRTRDLSERQSCIQAHVRLMIHWDGRVAPCCPAIGNNLLIGNINEQSVTQIFNSMEAKTLRRELKDKTAFTREPCKSCSSFESYKGFKAVWNS